MAKIHLEILEIQALADKVIVDFESQIGVAKSSLSDATDLMRLNISDAKAKGVSYPSDQSHPILLPGLANEPEKFSAALNSYYAAASVDRWTHVLRNLEIQLGNARHVLCTVASGEPVCVNEFREFLQNYSETTSCGGAENDE
jgi:hypothetical protein